MIEWSRRRKSDNWPLDFMPRKPSETFKNFNLRSASQTLLDHKSLEDLVQVESDSVGLGWGLKFCIPDNTSHDTDADGLQTTLGVVRP